MIGSYLDFSEEKGRFAETMMRQWWIVGESSPSVEVPFSRRVCVHKGEKEKEKEKEKAEDKDRNKDKDREPGVIKHPAALVTICNVRIYCINWNGAYDQDAMITT